MNSKCLSILVLFFFSVCAFSSANDLLPERITKAINSGQIHYRLTTPEDMESIFGKPVSKEISQDGEFEILKENYSLKNSAICAYFSRFSGNQLFKKVPFSLLGVSVNDNFIEIGSNRVIELKTLDDLAKFDQLSGFDKVSLKRLNLKSQIKILESVPFSSETIWPESSKLPKGFSPSQYLSQGKDPGLGIRALHKRGIDGRGIHIAIIDQPLFLESEEYKNNIVATYQYEVDEVPSQMHSSAVVGIAVGKESGVAPGAMVSFFATPSWKNDNLYYVKVFEKILEINQKSSLKDKIRVVSLSSGMFADFAHYEEFKEARKKLENSGVLFLTCLQEEPFASSALQRIPGKDPNLFSSYQKFYQSGQDVLLVPAGGRTLASHLIKLGWKYDPVGGLSWTPPYLAGLAALSIQVKPDITSRQIIELLQKTAIHTPIGKIVYPEGFINEVEKL